MILRVRRQPKRKVLRDAVSLLRRGSMRSCRGDVRHRAMPVFDAGLDFLLSPWLRRMFTTW